MMEQFVESFLSKTLRALFSSIFMYTLESALLDIERNLIITVLKLTKSGPVSHEIINKAQTSHPWLLKSC